MKNTNATCIHSSDYVPQAIRKVGINNILKNFKNHRKYIGDTN